MKYWNTETLFLASRFQLFLNKSLKRMNIHTYTNTNSIVEDLLIEQTHALIHKTQILSVSNSARYTRYGEARYVA